MEITTSIDVENIKKYAKRQTLAKMKIAGIIFGGFSFLLLLITGFSSFGFIFPLIFGFIFFIMYIATLNTVENMTESMEIIINDNAIILNHSKNKLGNFTNVSMELNKMRFGTKFDKVFPFSKIESTEIREREIIITSTEFSFLDDNIIRIPSECIKYDEIISEIRTNKSKYKLINT